MVDLGGQDDETMIVRSKELKSDLGDYIGERDSFGLFVLHPRRIFDCSWRSSASAQSLEGDAYCVILDSLAIFWLNEVAP